jgi:hypothetical protein
MDFESHRTLIIFHKLREWAPFLFGGGLIVWLLALSLLPDPRPLSAPQWSVRAVQSVAGVSEPMARAGATLALRGVGVGAIGILLALALGRLPMLYAAPAILLASPVLAIAAKWINFGYFPIAFQLRGIVAMAIVGALLGLAVHRNRFAIAGLMSLCLAAFVWSATLGVPDDLYQAARATGRHLLEKAEGIPQGDAAFERLLELAFAYAEDNSHGTDAVMPNQAAILALGVILGEDQVARVARRELYSGERQQRAAIRRRTSLQGRGDLSQHFWVSAALAVLLDENQSLTIGIGKELKDSTPGGSGFSFVDMAANKAGIRFAVAATRDQYSARSVQLRIARGVKQEDYLPSVTDLPEGISADDFHSVFGGLGGQPSVGLFAEIDRRLSLCEGLQ